VSSDDTVILCEAEVVETGTELAKAPSAALVAALERADEYRRHTKAEATEAAYASDWRRFLTWAASAGAAPLPATPEIVSAHLSWLAEEGYSVATLERFLAAGSHFHRAAGSDFPRNAYAVSETLKGIRRRVGVKRTKKAPLGLTALSEACTRVLRESDGAEAPERRLALRNRAMLTVGWFCMLRSANLVAIRREHVRLVRFDGDGWIDDEDRPTGLIVHLPESKTDQLKEGRDVAVHAQADETVCPVRALKDYLSAASIGPEDRIFPVSERTVSRLIKRLAANPEHGHKSLKEIARCDSCATAAKRFASHSLRRGAATAQAQRGISEREIMRQGGWKNERVMRGYIEHATLFQNNPTKDLSGVVEERGRMVAGHEQALENHFDKITKKNPEWVNVVSEIRTKLFDGAYHQWLVDAFFQKWRGNPSLAEVYCFSQLYSSYLKGEIGIFSVGTSSCPLPDKNKSGNQAVLDGLPDLFEAQFFGGIGDNDGKFEWKRPVKITRCFANADGTQREEPWECPPTWLPLEVGYTAVSKTFEHVVSEFGVARWPYDYEMIIVLVTHPSLRERRREKLRQMGFA